MLLCDLAIICGILILGLVLSPEQGTQPPYVYCTLESCHWTVDNITVEHVSFVLSQTINAN